MFVVRLHTGLVPVVLPVVCVDVHSVCVFVCFCSFARSVCSSDSSDSRLPIIRRGEESMEETYDESYFDDREYHEDDHSLSSDMYCRRKQRKIFSTSRFLQFAANNTALYVPVCSY